MERFDKSKEKLRPLQLDAFLEAVMPQNFRSSHGVHDNAIEQRHIIVYGRQGVGKTNCANWIVNQAVKRYGEDQVNVQRAMGENFHDLLTSSKWTRQRIQILVVEDLTNVKLRDEELRDFFRIRHFMNQQTGLLEGLCLVVFTCHRFHDTPISFRSDHDGLLVLSAPTNDFDIQFIKRKITEKDLELLDKAEANGQLGLAIITYRRSLIGYLELPYSPPIEVDIKSQTAVVFSARYAGGPSPDRSQRTYELASSFQKFMDELATRWETWNLPFLDKVVITFLPLFSLLLLIGGLDAKLIGNVVIGLLGLAGSYLFWRRTKR
jgi:hypothetical protein